ncbi:uncharacterized protein BDW70DRAFT_145266 [Aspergillus foveolatus]|uniref:uncharacterized protein n=1 Tax=Aspergillus foveolatus TaxID=210207 RepID=UPI003CCDEA5D
MSHATGRPARHGLGSLVDGYMRRKLRRDIHPALEALGDHNNESAVNSQVIRSQSSVRGEDTEPMELVTSTPSAVDKDNNDLDELYRDAMLEKDRFQEAMEAYEQTTAGSKFKTHVTSKSLHTWEEVLDEVNRAAETYHSRAAVWGKIRAGLRRLGDNSKVFEAWAALLPSGSDCATVISGGLKLILTAAARLSDLRREISDALVEIPSRLACIHQALNIFKGSKDLHRCSISLYVATLALLHNIVSWYRMTAIKKLGLSLLLQGSYEQNMDSLLQTLRAESERFDRAARLCSYGAIEETRLISIKNEQILSGYVDQSMARWDNFQTELRSTQASTRDGIHTLHHQVSDLHAIMERFLGSHDAVDPKTLNVRGPMLPSDKAAVNRRSQQMYLRSRDYAFSALNYDPSTLEKDLAANLHNVWHLPLLYQNRLLATMQTPELHAWITTPYSSALFLNLNTPAVSPLHASSSFLPAKLVQSINEQPSENIITLAFFCGAHARLTDSHSGPQGTMRSLVAQLLESHPGFDLQTVQRTAQLRGDDVHGLCEVFHDLVGQLPADVVVFCVVDGVTAFEERMGLRESGEEVVQALVRTVQECAQGKPVGGRCVLKLLLTSPRNSRRLWRLIPGEVGDVVWMPDAVPSLGGFTVGKWNASVGGALN